jgi:hypothetical protein
MSVPLLQLWAFGTCSTVNITIKNVSMFTIAIFYKLRPTKNRLVDIIYFRIWRIILFFISPVSSPRSCPSHEAETWRMTAPLALSAADKHSISDMHMYVCKKSGHYWTLCEGRRILAFHVRAHKFLVICEWLVSVILRLFKRIFLIFTFLLDIMPLDIIKRNWFFFWLHQVTRLYNL